MAHVGIIRKMDQHLDDARVQLVACKALTSLAANDANKVTLVAAGAHVRIIRAMDRHQDDAQVQEAACGALMNLAETTPTVDASSKRLRAVPPSAGAWGGQAADRQARER